LRQSIASTTKQDAQEVISLSQLFDCGFSGVQKRFAEAIATDFAKRIREESELSDTTWYIKGDSIINALKRVRDDFDELEKSFHSAKLQSLEPGDLVCPDCNDTFAQQRALEIHQKIISRSSVCQGKCKECESSSTPCDLSRSTGPCTRCRTSGLACYFPRDHWQCPKCLWRLGITSSYTHESSCPGQCIRCQKHNLPCRSRQLKLGKQLEDCIYCIEAGEQCIRPHPE
jgi:hypothetical protein